MNDETPKTRHCNKCDSTKELDSFPRKKATKRDGRASVCKACNSRRSIENYPKNKEKFLRDRHEYYLLNADRIIAKQRAYSSLPENKIRISKYQHEHLLNNSELYIYRRAKIRARKLSIPFTITIEDIEIPKYCPVLRIELRHGTSASRDHSPSLDRIVPALGYVPGNIIVMSKRANTLKSNGTLEEHRKLVEWMETL